jgi:hypothetical protein
MANRWRLMQPYLDQMASYATNDVRGYYFLSNMKDRDSVLKNYSQLPSTDRDQVTEWLLEMCGNSQNTRGYCEPELQNVVKAANGSALDFYQTFAETSRAMYDHFFKIPNFGVRSDIVWSRSKHDIATIPFTDPQSAAYRMFMLNVEDEWKWESWHLKLNFVQDRSGRIPHLEFKAGVTPHVNAIGGNIITMDANTPLNDWENGWIIRHEFGHVLGFPDCYVEFYDTSKQAMINYQLDITNLMCSRMGNLKQTHYDEMKRVYLR